MSQPLSVSLEEKIIVVTGAGRGIGKAMAMTLAEAGGTLAIVSRTREEIERTAQQIRDAGGTAYAYPADVRDAFQMEDLAGRIQSRFGRVDVLVHSAGFHGGLLIKPILETSEEEWDMILDTNLKGTFLCARAFGRHMVKRRQGKIILVGSIIGVRPFPNRIPYAVSKAAVMHLTRALAMEWAPYNVLVNCVAPNSFERPEPDPAVDNEERRRTRSARIPLGRLGELHEMTPLIVFMASDLSTYMTGETVVLDGGESVRA